MSGDRSGHAMIGEGEEEGEEEGLLRANAVRRRRRTWQCLMT